MLYILHNKFVKELWKVFAVLEIDKENEIHQMKCLGNAQAIKYTYISWTKIIN